MLRFIFTLFVLFLFTKSNSQDYFDFFYTNIPKTNYDAYSVANLNGIGWLQTGNYKSPLGCKDCYNLMRDTKVTPLFMDSLVKLYDATILDTLYKRKYVPSYHYFKPAKNPETPTIFKTLYSFNKGKMLPLVQIKMTFYDRENLSPGILSIELLQQDKMTKFDPKIVLESYRKQLEKDKSDSAPEVLKN
jgi:hypothetical protein